MKPGFFANCETDEGRRRARQWPLIGRWVLAWVPYPGRVSVFLCALFSLFFLMAVRWAL